jgi:endo-1,4-beta-D-glucanase Y
MLRFVEEQGRGTPLWACVFGWLGLIASLAIVPAGAQSSQIDHARLWQAYSERFISSDGRVIDPQGGDRTTSEGQSYALFFALVNNDRGQFDRVLTWTESNLAAGDLGLHLPAWSWGRGKDGNWGVLDPNSASDSDLWIAYDLIEAGRLWTDLHYANLGRRLAAIVAHKEVANLPGLSPVLLPGASGFRLPRFWVINPSYTPLFLVQRLAKADPEGPWASVAMDIPLLLERSAMHGFAMDWVCYTPGEGFAPCQSNGRKTPEPLGSYDAIRVYLWAGMLPDSSPAKARILKSLPAMNLYMQQHDAPPEKVNSEGVPMNPPGPVGFSAALLPYLSGNANQAAVAQQLVRIKSQLDEKSNLYGAGYGTGPTYYDQNLVLFGSGWIEKRFQFGNSGELLLRWSR